MKQFKVFLSNPPVMVHNNLNNIMLDNLNNTMLDNHKTKDKFITNPLLLKTTITIKVKINNLLICEKPKIYLQISYYCILFFKLFHLNPLNM